MQDNTIKKRNIFVNFLVILSLVSLVQISIFPYLFELLTSSNKSSEVPVSIVIVFVLVLNLVSIIISIFISSLVAYFFGRIFDANTSKKTFIYILSSANIIVYLVNIPLAIGNFLNNDSTKVIMFNHPIFIFCNPLIYISVYVFYKLLQKYTQLSRRVIIGYCICFYLLKIVGIIFSQIQLI